MAIKQCDRVLPLWASSDELRGGIDRPLGGLDRFIAKERTLKQITMHELLNGRTRLI